MCRWVIVAYLPWPEGVRQEGAQSALKANEMARLIERDH
jgi:hypothetical protein